MTDTLSIPAKTYIINAGGPLEVFYWSDTNQTLTIELLDLQGNTVIGGTDALQVNVTAGANDLTQSITGWLDQHDSTLSQSGLGIYILKVGSLYQPIIIGWDFEAPETVDGVEPQYIYVVDLDTGLWIILESSDMVPLNSDRLKLIAFQYYYDTKTGRGRLKTHSQDPYAPQFDTGWAYHAIITYGFKFQTLNDLANFIARVATPLDFNVFKLGMEALWGGDPQDAITILKPFMVWNFFRGYVFNVDVDVNNLEFRVTELVPLGRFSIDWSKIKKGLLVAAGAIAVVGASVVLGPEAGMFTALALGPSIAAYVYDTKDATREEAETLYYTGIAKLKEMEAEFNDYVDQKVQEGKIDPQVGEELKQRVEAIVATAVKHLEDIKNLFDKCWKSGYKKGYGEARSKWGAIGAAAGAVASFILNKKI